MHHRCITRFGSGADSSFKMDGVVRLNRMIEPERPLATAST